MMNPEHSPEDAREAPAADEPASGEEARADPECAPPAASGPRGAPDLFGGPIAKAVERPGARVVILGAAVVIVGAGIKLAAPVLVPLLLAVFLAMVTAPLVFGLRRVGVPHVVAVTLGILADMIALGAFTGLFVVSLTGLSDRLPEYGSAVAARARAIEASLAPYIGADAISLPSLVQPDAIVSAVGSLVGGVAGIVGTGALVLLLALFILLEIDRMAFITPVDDAAPRTGSSVEINRYLAVKTGASVATGGCIALWTWLVGLDLPLLWGLTALTLNYIPNLGSFIAGIPATLLAFIVGGAGLALAVAAGYLVVNTVIGSIIEPRVMGRALGLSPLAVLLSVIIWGWLLGVTGALLGSLLTVVLKIVTRDTTDFAWIARALSGEDERRD